MDLHINFLEETSDISQKEFLDDDEKAKELAEVAYNAAKPLLKRINMRSKSRAAQNRYFRRAQGGKFRSMSNLHSGGNRIRVTTVNAELSSNAAESPMKRLRFDNVSAKIQSK